MGRVANMILAGVALVIPFGLAGQNNTARPTFEVVSIRPSPPNAFPGAGPRGDRWTTSRNTLRGILIQAFGTGRNTDERGRLEIVGGPSWIANDLYNVEAKADCRDGVIAAEQLGLMLQAMVEDRFQLKAHFETREVEVYDLVVAKEGSKLKRSADQTPVSTTAFAQLCAPVPERAATTSDARSGTSSLPAPLRGSYTLAGSPAGTIFQGEALTATRMAYFLESFAGRRVIDKTGLTGLFDFKLEFSQESVSRLSAEPAPPGSFPPLTSVLGDLGLKLEPSRGTIEVLVVDSAEKPSEN